MNNYKERKKRENNQLGTNSLDFDEIIIQPSLRIWYIYLCIFILILLAKLVFMLEQQYFELLWRGIVSAGAAYLAYIFLSHITTSYTVNALEVVGHSGVFSKKVVRIPLNRITNYECKASFLERVIGMNNVMLDTPGGTGYELTMSRLLRRDADLVVGHLRYLMGQQKIAEAGSNKELRTLREKAVVN